ncbi:hypothetical protein AB0I53_32840 [Saccharopolyspora sp. NPDC050389]
MCGDLVPWWFPVAGRHVVDVAADDAEPAGAMRAADENLCFLRGGVGRVR